MCIMYVGLGVDVKQRMGRGYVEDKRSKPNIEGTVRLGLEGSYWDRSSKRTSTPAPLPVSWASLATCRPAHCLSAASIKSSPLPSLSTTGASLRAWSCCANSSGEAEEAGFDDEEGAAAASPLLVSERLCRSRSAASMMPGNGAVTWRSTKAAPAYEEERRLGETGRWRGYGWGGWRMRRAWADGLDGMHPIWADGEGWMGRTGWMG